MKSCPFATSIDPYLQNELSGKEAERFEAHTFDCPSCYREMSERHLLLEALREGGSALFSRPVRTAPAWIRAAAAAALVLLVAAGIALLSPRPHRPSEFAFTGDETVRGAALEIVGPAGPVGAAPERLEWHPLARAAEYEVTLSEAGKTIWTVSTAATEAGLPADVRTKLRPGVDYVWRVRAFAALGSFIAVSDPAAFRIAR
jgi:hypothetical protein